MLLVGEKWIILKKNFSTNQNSRKYRGQLFHFLTFGIERGVNSDDERILLNFFVMFVMGEKCIILKKNFSTNQNSRKNQTHLSDFFIVGIERGVNTDDEKIRLTFV